MNSNKFSAESSPILKAHKSNVSSQSYGRSLTDVYDWLADLVMPTNYEVCTIVEVKFKGSRKEFYSNFTNIILKNGELVVVSGNRGGYDVGRVSLTGELVRMQMKKKKLRAKNIFNNVYRLANTADIIKWKLAKDSELETLQKARVLAKGLGLSMKLTDVDYQGDGTKATFYYTADTRVDYRELIKHLFGAFGVRIEMLQIGTREEASRIGDIGPCGNYSCCHTWSTNFKTNSPFSPNSQSNLKRGNNKFQCYIEDEMVHEDIGESDY